MKQWNLRMKKLWSKTLLVKPWLKRTEMKRPVHICEKLLKKSDSYCSKASNTENVEIFHGLPDKVPLLMRKRSERSEQKIVTKFFWKGLDNACIYIYVCVCMYVCFISIWISIYRENVNWKTIFYDSDKIENRLPFYRSLFSTFWNRVGGLCTQVFYFH